MTTTDDWFESVPILEGWINLTEAAERLGVSPQHVSRLAHGDAFKTIRRVGNKKMLVVSSAEVDAMAEARRLESADEELAGMPS